MFFTTQIKTTLKLLVTLSFMGVSTHALAQDVDGLDEDDAPVPGVEANLLIEYQSDNVLSGDGNIDGSQTYSTHELDAAIHFSRFISLYATLNYQPQRGFLHYFDEDLFSEDTFFEDQGVDLEQFFLEFEYNNVAIFGGKFTPNFGKAWDETPGVYGTDFAKDYENLDNLGFGAEVEFEKTPFGNLTLGAAGFQLDRTLLSSSLFQNTDQNEKSDGGAGNTDGIQSYVISADLEKILGNNSLNAHFAYINRKKGIGPDDYDDEKGFVFTLYGERDLGRGFTAEWIGEVALIDNFNATEDNINYYTIGLDIEYQKRFHWAISYTNRDVDNPWDGEYEEHLFQTSVGLEVWDKWNFDVGYRYTETGEDGDNAHFLGLLVSKEFEYRKPAN